MSNLWDLFDRDQNGDLFSAYFYRFVKLIEIYWDLMDRKVPCYINETYAGFEDFFKDLYALVSVIAPSDDLI